MGIVLAARPGALLAIIYKPAYGEGAEAMPILVAGECCLALLGVVCAILNAAGPHPRDTFLRGADGGRRAPRRRSWFRPLPSARRCCGQRRPATALGMAVGFVAAIVYVRARLGGTPARCGTVARGGAGSLAGVAVARIIPGQGKIVGLAAIALAAVAYVAVLVGTGELGAADRAKLARMLRRQ